MSTAYRCSKCGQFRDGSGVHVHWDTPDDRTDWPSIDLCPNCAPAVVAPLVAIAATKHGGSMSGAGGDRVMRMGEGRGAHTFPRAPEAQDEPDGSEMILSMGETRTGTEHTAEDDAVWTSESDG